MTLPPVAFRGAGRPFDPPEVGLMGSPGGADTHGGAGSRGIRPKL